MDPTTVKAVVPSDIQMSDIIIAVMGPTGSGKSTFIDKATKQDGRTVGHGLQSMTSEIRAVRFEHQDLPYAVVLVDTPGFEDTHRPDTMILTMIAEWLSSTYKFDKKLSAILYLHDMRQPRMTGAHFRNLNMFNQLCGDGALQNVTFVTTKSITAEVDRVERDRQARREEDLMNVYWKPMLDKNARTARFENTYESAWQVLASATDKDKCRLLVQQEMVDFQKRLSETHAGQALCKSFELLSKRHRDVMDQLLKQVKTQTDPLIVEELKRDFHEIQEKWKATLYEAQTLKIPLRRRVRNFFTRAGPTAKPVTLPSPHPQAS